MKLKIAMLCLLLLASCASAFPLTGGNGEGINATVFGTFTIPDSSIGPGAIYVDLFVNTSGYNEIIPEEVAFLKAINDDYTRFNGFSETSNWNAILVDNDDIYYGPAYKKADLNNGRCILEVEIPTSAKPKRLRIEPSGPVFGYTTNQGKYARFQINWTPFFLELNETVDFSIPDLFDVSTRNGNIVLNSFDLNNTPKTFIKDTALKPYILYNIFNDHDEAVVWMIDIKLQNNAAEPQTIKCSYFQMTDQYGWKYKASEFDTPPMDDRACVYGWGYRTKGVDSMRLLPGEARRVGLVFDRVSVISTPAMILEYMNKSMNLSI